MQNLKTYNKILLLEDFGMKFKEEQKFVGI